MTLTKVIARFDRDNIAADPASADQTFDDDGEFLLFTNPGLKCEPASLQTLADYLRKRPWVGAVGGMVVSPQFGVYHTAIAFGPDRLAYPLYRGFPSDHSAVNKSRRVQALAAEFMMVRKAALSEVGGIEAEVDDLDAVVDFCLRLADRDWEVHYCHEAVALLATGKKPNDREVRSRPSWFLRVYPDELQYYWEDGLIRFEQHMLYPLEIEFAAPLSVAEKQNKVENVADMLRTQSRRMLEMVKENLRLKEWCEKMNDSPAGSS